MNKFLSLRANRSQGSIIQIETAPGKGTTLVISVPVVTSADAGEEKVEALSSLSGLRVLIVEDDFEVRDFTPRMLPGHIADTAESGAEALEKMRGAAYDLVITDWVMSGMSGNWPRRSNRSPPIRPSSSSPTGN